MKLERLKRWHWMIVAVVVGLIISGVRQMAGRDIDITTSISRQIEFERALIQEVKDAKTGQVKRHLINLKVIPDPSRRDPDRTWYIVIGDHYSGRPERRPDGTLLARHRPSFFRELSKVYTPQIKLEQFNKPGGPDYAKKFKEIKNPTVLDFLQIMKEAKGVEYTYAWWAEPVKGTILWVGLSFVAIGLIWPTVVSLLAYGQLTPPPEEKGIDLSKVRPSSTSAPSRGPTGPTAEDMDELSRMEQALKAKIAEADAGAPQPAPAAAPAGPAPIKQLTATKLEVAQADEHKDHKEFGAAADDFYPTERKVAKPKPPDQPR